MRPRVAVVLSGYGVVQRGAETMLDQLLPRLEPHFDFEVYSMSGRGPGGRAKGAIPRTEIEPIYLAARSSRKVLDTLYLDPLHVEWTTHLLHSLPDLYRRRYDVIWHETGLWGGKILAGLRRHTGVRLLDVAHSSYPGWELPFARCRPDAYVTADRHLAGLVRQEFPHLRVEIVPQAVDTELFQPDGETLELDLPRPIALIPGALAPEKSPEIALRAVARTGASALVAGSGPLAWDIDTMATDMLAPDRYLRVEVERTEMPTIYRAADVVVLASPLESGALAVLEAMACGVPVVTTDDTVRREILGDAGELVGSREIADFSAAIGRTLARDWGSQPRQRALEFSVDRASESFRAILMSLAETQP